MNAPAFQFYPADHLSDMRVRMLSWESRGLYIDLLCYCWREGWIPSDSSAIAQLCQCYDTDIIDPCLSLFSPDPQDPGKLIHPRLDREREKQKAFREERKASGIRGAAKRWKGDSSAINQPMAENGSSIYNLQSSNIPPISPNGESKPPRKKFTRPTLEEITAYGRTLSPPFLKAKKFFNYYNSNGWKVGKNPMQDWQSAVGNWNEGDSPQPINPLPEGAVMAAGGRIFVPKP